MIPKVAQYGGFQSYGKKPYTNLKPGHISLDFDDVWQKCLIFILATREQDKLPLYDSYNRNSSLYKMGYGNNVSQKDFVAATHIPKGNNGTKIYDIC